MRSLPFLDHVETQEGDAEAATEEDTAMEDTATEKEGLDLAKHQAQVQFEEEQLLEAGDDLEDTFNVSFDSPPSSPGVAMEEEDEGLEETEKQRREGKDYMPTRYPSTSTLPASEKMNEVGPHRCMTDL